MVRQNSSVLVPPRTDCSSSSSDAEEGEGEDDDFDDNASSTAATDTTETTLVGKNDNELQEEVSICN